MVFGAGLQQPGAGLDRTHGACGCSQVRSVLNKLFFFFSFFHLYQRSPSFHNRPRLTDLVDVALFSISRFIRVSLQKLIIIRLDHFEFGIIRISCLAIPLS